MIGTYGLIRIMPAMLRGFIPEDEWLVLAELSYFFRVGVRVDLQVTKDLSAKLL